MEWIIGVIFMGIVIGLSRNIGTGISNGMQKMMDDDNEDQKG